ncbi:MAG: hypothetical protein FJX51_12025, partial [Alphaproteobacteria bacterium]|nr:hypothetical protein [Alphaproteobacteria bacterium]
MRREHVGAVAEKQPKQPVAFERAAGRALVARPMGEPEWQERRRRAADRAFASGALGRRPGGRRRGDFENAPISFGGAEAARHHVGQQGRPIERARPAFGHAVLRSGAARRPAANCPQGGLLLRCALAQGRPRPTAVIARRRAMHDLSARGPVRLNYPKYKYHFSEFIGIGSNGHLWVDGCDVVDLVKRFGSPLNVFSEGQFRHNYRRFRDAFQAHYPNTQILFANKSNNSIAMRHIMNQEGAGGDCFGVNEMYIALLAGTDARTLVLNGSNKEPEEIEMAIRNGICINLDAMDEVDLVHETAKRLGMEADVGVRVKLELKALEHRYGRGVHSGSMAEIVWHEKWGMPYDQAAAMVKRIRATMPTLHLKELHFHLSRLDNQARDFAVMAREMVEWSARLRDDTGWTPPFIDLGGGWTFGRKEKTGVKGGIDDERVSSFEDYGREVAEAVKDECQKRNLPLPGLKIEPGRAIAGMSGISVGRVGAVKDWPQKNLKWVNVDLSGNHVPWITIPHHYHIVPVNKA